MQPDAKRAMVRLVTVEGAIVTDFEARQQGRGGYLHRRRECLDRFVGSKVKVFRSLRRKIDLDERRKIADQIAQAIGSDWNGPASVA
jgi:predicted RNA-binding protein YlxR (DUF448 family)